MVYLSKYDYDDIEEWGKRISPSDYSKFYNPIRRKNHFSEKKKENNIIFYERIKGNEEISKNSYRTLNRIVRSLQKLVNINSENLIDEVFNKFNELRNV